MRRVLYIFAALLFALTGFSAFDAGAVSCRGQSDTFSGQCTDTPLSYKLTIKAVRLRNADTGEFVVIGDTAKEFDFASANAGEAVGSFISGATIPAGRYDAISPILDPVQKITARTQLTTNTCRTDAENDGAAMRDGGTPEEFAFDTSSYASTGSDAVEGQLSNTQYINSDGDFVIIDSNVAGFPLTVVDGAAYEFTMAVDVSTAAEFTFTGGNCGASSAYPGHLGVSMSVKTTGG